MGPYCVTRKLSDLTYEIQKSPKDRPIVVHVDKLKKCVSWGEPNINPVVHNKCVCAFQIMPKKKTKASSETERKNKEHACPECKKPFLRKTDADRHFEMKHLLVKRECRHCGTILGSVSALRRHLEKQHQIKLSTHPDSLDPERWKVTPLDENPIQEGMETSEVGESSSRDTLTVRSVLKDRGTNEGSAPTSLVPAASVAGRAIPASSSIPIGFGDPGGYTDPEASRRTEGHPPAVEGPRALLPSDQEVLEGREQLRAWKQELITAPRPIIEDFWLSRWRRQTPKLGFATRLAAEAMLDVAVMMQRTVKNKLDPAVAYETRPGCCASTYQTVYRIAE